MKESNKKFVTQLFQKYHQDLYGYLVHRLRGNTVEAADIAQETYLRLLRMKDTDIIEQPHAYLYKVASHVIRELGLKELKHNNLPTRLSEYHLEDQAIDSPEKHLQTQIEVEQLENIMNKMPPIYKSVLLLRKQHGLSHKEIAKKLNISIHTVKKYMYRALSWCRENTAIIAGEDQ